MATTIQQTLGQRVRAQRVKTGLSKVDFSLQLGISRVSLDLIESGHANLKLSTLNQLASNLGVEPWELIMPLDAKCDPSRKAQ